MQMLMKRGRQKGKESSLGRESLQTKDKHHFLWTEINVKRMESTASQMASLSQESEGTLE